jgi:hypothetical protein
LVQTDDDLVGLGFPEYEDGVPPDIQGLAHALQAVVQLRAGVELIQGISADIALTGTIVKWIATALPKVSRQISPELISVCNILLRGLDDATSDIDVDRTYDKFREILENQRSQLWPFLSSAPLFFQFSEHVRAIGEAKQHLEWLMTFAKNSTVLADAAEKFSIEMQAWKRNVDALSQLVGLLGYIRASGGRSSVSEDHVQQLNMLLRTLSEGQPDQRSAS